MPDPHDDRTITREIPRLIHEDDKKEVFTCSPMREDSKGSTAKIFMAYVQSNCYDQLYSYHTKPHVGPCETDRAFSIDEKDYLVLKDGTLILTSLPKDGSGPVRPVFSFDLHGGFVSRTDTALPVKVQWKNSASSRANVHPSQSVLISIYVGARTPANGFLGDAVHCNSKDAGVIATSSHGDGAEDSWTILHQVGSQEVCHRLNIFFPKPIDHIDGSQPSGAKNLSQTNPLCFLSTAPPSGIRLDESLEDQSQKNGWQWLSALSWPAKKHNGWSELASGKKSPLGGAESLLG